MNTRSVVILLIIVAALSAGVTYVLTSGSDDGGEDTADGLSVASGGTPEVIERFVTIPPMIISATPDPNVIMITMTPAGNAAVVPPADDGSEATDGIDDQAAVDGEVTPEVAVTVQSFGSAASLDATLIDSAGRFIGTQEELPTGCILHTLVDGDFPTLIIENYELPPETTFVMLSINGLTEDTARFLQIGDQLVVPGEGCPVDQFLEAQGELPADVTTDEAEGTEEITPEVTVDPNITPTPTVEPTITLAPTVQGAQVEIVNVIGAGDLLTEGVEIVNNGNTIDISGWTLSDGDGNVYVFPDQRRLFSGASVTVNTRTGDNTAILFFWNLEEPVFSEPGDVVVLTDADGDVQSSIRLP